MAIKKKVTIKDVAKEAGVALGTISHFLNESAPVSGETANRIQEAINRLGYRVNLGARGLRSNRTNSVGLVLPNISNPFYAELARSIEHALWQKGFQTLLCDAWYDPSREQKHLEMLADRRVDGILIIYTDEHHLPLGVIDQISVPVVFVDRAVRDRHSVTSDNWLGGVLAARHLIELGHKRIGLLAGESTITNSHQRIEGFLGELSKNGINLTDKNIVYGPIALELGAQVEQLMRQKSPPTAVFATNDIVAIGAWRKLLEMGYQIPSDVSLIGFDNIEIGRLVMPALSTIAQDKNTLGQEAASLLLRVMQAEVVPVTTITVAPNLVMRDSTAPPKHK